MSDRHCPSISIYPCFVCSCLLVSILGQARQSETRALSPPMKQIHIPAARALPAFSYGLSAFAVRRAFPRLSAREIFAEALYRLTPKLSLTGHRRPRCWRGGARTAMSGMCYVAPSWTAPRQGPRRQRRSSRSISYEHSRRAPGRGTVSTRARHVFRLNVSIALEARHVDSPRGARPTGRPTGRPAGLRHFRCALPPAPRRQDARCAAHADVPARGPRPSPLGMRHSANDCGNAMLRNLRCM